MRKFIKLVTVTLLSLLSFVCKSQDVDIRFARSSGGGSCYDAIIQNRSGIELKIPHFEYSYQSVWGGRNGIHSSTSAYPNVGHHLAPWDLDSGLKPGASVRQGVNTIGDRCDLITTPQLLSYKIFNVTEYNSNVTAQNERSRQSSNALFDQLAQREREKLEQRRRDNEEAQRRKDAEIEKERQRVQAAAADPCLQLRQYCDRRTIARQPAYTEQQQQQDFQKEQRERERQANVDFSRNWEMQARQRAEEQARINENEKNERALVEERNKAVAEAQRENARLQAESNARVAKRRMEIEAEIKKELEIAAKRERQEARMRELRNASVENLNVINSNNQDALARTNQQATEISSAFAQESNKLERLIAEMESKKREENKTENSCAKKAKDIEAFILPTSGDRSVILKAKMKHVSDKLELFSLGCAVEISVIEQTDKKLLEQQYSDLQAMYAESEAAK